MGRRTKLKPQSRIQRKSSSGNIPSFLYGKYFIQSGSVEKYSNKLKPNQAGFLTGEGGSLRPSASPLRTSTLVPISAGGRTMAVADAANDFSILRRLMPSGDRLIACPFGLVSADFSSVSGCVI